MWATTAEVKTVTGKTVTDEDTALAHAVIELTTGLIAGVGTAVAVEAGGGIMTITRNGNIVSIEGTYAFEAVDAFALIPAWADPAYLTISESTLERVVPASLNGGAPVVTFQATAGAIKAVYLTTADPGPANPGSLRTDTTRRDLYWLRQAVAFQAAWLADTPDYLERNDVESASQDGQSVTLKQDALVLAPLARRAIKKLSWRGSRSIRPVPVDERGRIRLTPDYVPLEAHDDLQVWRPL